MKAEIAAPLVHPKLFVLVNRIRPLPFISVVRDRRTFRIARISLYWEQLAQEHRIRLDMFKHDVHWER